MENSAIKHYTETRDKLNATGCGMCLAKWTQVTIHLHLGRNHSCHHPDTHPIPISEVLKDPSALHNTQFKKLKRKEMLEGQRPSECGYCWNVEDSSNEFSDRTFKSSEPWSAPFHDEIVSSPWDKNIYPKYVEVAFANTCNLKCSYCGPSFSSSWVQEAKKFGGYPTTDNFNDIKWMEEQGRMPYNHKDYNPYIEAFWKWWPDLYRNLHTFRMTGGEPLLAKDTWKVLDYIIEEKNPNMGLNVSINSNLGVPDELIDKLIDKINRITQPTGILGGSKSKVNEFVLFTSVDGWGDQAEYGRSGLDFNIFWDNLNKILTKCPKLTISIMSTYNALSVPSYSKLIMEVHNLKRVYHSENRAWKSALGLDSSYLRNPLHQTVQVLPAEFQPIVQNHGTLVKALMDTEMAKYNHHMPSSWTYSDMEYTKIKRVYDWMIAPQDEVALMKNRYNFYKFFSTHDKRRGTDFCKTFPIMEDFFRKCGEIDRNKIL